MISERRFGLLAPKGTRAEIRVRDPDFTDAAFKSPTICANVGRRAARGCEASRRASRRDPNRARES